ncbi:MULTISPECIES: RluA family pseudouridine synthase [Aminobacterium]|jgi:23S rRNA pseudouridine955/2504/2580 synthase|uniref:RluA family pseudouridine synthase n=1 Tax=Aminobacterium TaxID=81466 RepID=UPI00046579BD|nr:MULTISPECIES: RluA family pseudouridine synthase [Aminobacterium]
MSCSFKVSVHQAGRRLDKVIRSLWPRLPLGAMMKGIRKGLVRVDGKKVDCSFHLEEGQTVIVPWEPAENIPAPALSPVYGKELEIVYQDAMLMAINKPAGLLVQPDCQGGDSVITRVWNIVGEKADFRPAAIHRIDRNTSGLVIIALHGQALRELQRALRDDDIAKFYLVAVRGKTPHEGTIDAPLLKDREHNIVTVNPEGQSALTRYVKIAGDQDYSLLQVELITGRSHQIRVHLASIGHPIVGDVKYGDDAVNGEWHHRIGLNHPLLHAWKVQFKHVSSPLKDREGKIFVAPPDELFSKFLEKRGWQIYLKGV